MAGMKVCLITGAAGEIGQQLAAELVAAGRKVIALGEPEDSFRLDVLQKREISVTTALPVTTALFKKHDVQFCFGDISDISFLASVFSNAVQNNLEIEFVFHLSANRSIQKSSPAAYHPGYIATANVLEVVRAYWQSHQKTFKGFFYTAESDRKSDAKTEAMLNRLKEKEGFPAVIFSDETAPVGSGYKGKTALASLYRVITPFTSSLSWKNESETENNYIRRLLHAVRKELEKADN